MTFRRAGLGIAVLSVLATPVAARAEPLMVRIAEVEVDPAQLEAYKAILKDEQEASVRAEPGVIMLHSVALGDAPNQIRLLEVYASRSAYEAHLKAPHFVKYKTATASMVTSLRLVETRPILLCAKAKGLAGGRAGGPVTCIDTHADGFAP